MMGSRNIPVAGNLGEEKKPEKENEKEWPVRLKENRENAVRKPRGKRLKASMCSFK